tara:strand:+ start:1781 stop:2149 length:369 start_codon:yes stop_codon:yes gene_type:complete
MKKILGLLTTLFLLNGCAESIALLGPVSTAAGGGKVAQSAFSSAVSYGIQKQTGKSPSQHAFAYVKQHNPENNKDKCVNFLEVTNSEMCAAIKKNILETKKSIVKNSKTKFLNSKEKLKNIK